MFVVTVLFEVDSTHAEQFRTRVQQQAADSLANEEGCRRFDVCADPSDPARIFLYEIYDDKAAFDAHLSSAHFKAFDAEVGPVTQNKQVGSWELI